MHESNGGRQEAPEGSLGSALGRHMKSLDGARCFESPKYLRSYEALLHDDFKEARRLLEELVEEFPDSGAFLNDLGICCYLEGEKERSRELLQRAARLQGKNSAPYINLRYIFDPNRFPDREEDLSANVYRIPEGIPPFPDAFVSIIILEYNNPELTLNCLRSIKASVTAVPYEVILIDNSEAGPSVDFGEAAGMDNLVYQRNKENVGFSAGCNQGAALAKGRFLYFVNNDTLFQKDCVEALAGILLLDERVGIVGSKLLYEDGTIQHAGVVFDCLNQMPKHRCVFSIADDPSANIPLELQAVTAASMMIRRDLFLALGGFPEEYVNGYEDVELCLKSGRAGHKVVYNPRSVLFHFESKSKGRSDHDDENRELFQKRWAQLVEPDELESLGLKDRVLLCYTENLKKRRRQSQLFSLFLYLDRKHPEIIDRIPLAYFEKSKQRRVQKFYNYVFYAFIQKARTEEAKVVYRHFLARHWFRFKYVREMRKALSENRSG